jgi:hypothetical protein
MKTGANCGTAVTIPARVIQYVSAESSICQLIVIRITRKLAVCAGFNGAAQVSLLAAAMACSRLEQQDCDNRLTPI